MWTFVSNKFNKMIKLILLLLSKKWIICFPFLFACGQPNTTQETEKGKQLARTLKEAERAKTVLDSGITLGNQRLAEYLPLLKGKQVGFVGNHTALIGESHLVDSLLNLGVDIVKVFSPEHGFRGIADAGEKIKDGIDPATKLPVFSLYGDQKKPTVKQMKDLDVLVFDLQDVGARFYTYISTLHYVMEATAENEIPLIVLDRPNPNAHYVDGPVLEENFQSFVGMHPVPIVHGMTIGEYAGMINGENWLKGGLKCKLHVVPCLSYNHQKPYNLELSPSPNLPNMRSIYLYPSLCLFEGTSISVGRGTAKPFQQIGAPWLEHFDHSFIPRSEPGAKTPKYENQNCKGVDFSNQDAEYYRKHAKLNLKPLLELYHQSPEPNQFFNSFFNLLAGNGSLQNDIKAGKSETEIRASWQKELKQFKMMREKYLLYP